jgi:hypothetical protein
MNAVRQLDSGNGDGRIAERLKAGHGGTSPFDRSMVLLVGRDEPRSGSPLRSRAVVWLFRASALTEGAWPLVLVPPLRTHRADFPQWAPQSAFADHAYSDRGVNWPSRGPGQFEPVTGLQITPVELMPLALLA